MHHRRCLYSHQHNRHQPYSPGCCHQHHRYTGIILYQARLSPYPLLNGSYHYQSFLYNPNATDTILSLVHIMWSSPSITTWQQSGSKDPSMTDTLTFSDGDGNKLLVLPLTSHNGLQYCTNDSSHTPTVHSVLTYSTAVVQESSTERCIMESELWVARLGFCSKWQLTKITQHVDDTPSCFFPHPLRFVDHKEQARVQKQPAGSHAEQAPLLGQ